MCFDGPKWKREVVPDHKFDFIDVRDYHSDSLGVRLQYVWLYILVIKSFLVYVSDIFTGVTMLSTEDWSNQIFASCPDQEAGCVFIPFKIARWLFVGCIIFSFLLLAYETRKTKRIIASRDISYAFTNVMANNYYSLRSYDHFCLFCHINDSTKTTDNFAFFVFFTFKEWKRLLLADGPRQSINALTLYSFYLSKKDSIKSFKDFDKFYESTDYVTLGLLCSITFTVIIFLGSLLLLIAAGICYVPLLCYIRGNLKEYCCHKVDKRIAEVVKKKTRERVQKEADLARKEAAGLAPSNLPQPTLPSVSVDDDDDQYPPKFDPYWADHKSDYQSSVRGAPAPAYSDYPPMPMNPYQNAGYADSVYNHSEHEYLANSGQPMGRGQTPAPNPYAQQQQQQYGDYPQHQYSTSGDYRSTSGLAYDQESVVPGRTPSRNQLQYGATRRSPGPEQWGNGQAGNGAGYGGGY